MTAVFARRLATLALPAAAAAAVLVGAATDANARPNIKRRGGQWGVTFGGAACIPGKAQCARDNVSEGGVTVDGRTRPSFGTGAELGYRFNKWVFAGAAYNLGFFDTSYEVSGFSSYKRGFQNSVYAVVRPTVPAWRFDFGPRSRPGLLPPNLRLRQRRPRLLPGLFVQARPHDRHLRLPPHLHRRQARPTAQRPRQDLPPAQHRQRHLDHLRRHGRARPGPRSPDGVRPPRRRDVPVAARATTARSLSPLSSPWPRGGRLGGRRFLAWRPAPARAPGCGASRPSSDDAACGAEARGRASA